MEKMKIAKRYMKVFYLLMLVTSMIMLASCNNNIDDSVNQSENNLPENEVISDSNEPIVFKDEVFEKLLKEALGKEKIMKSDLENYTGVKIASDKFMLLSGPDKPEESIILYADDTFEYDGERYTGFGTMKSLEDLKFFPKLNGLKITLQPEIDYSTIQYKNQITNLALTQSKISDVKFLSDATNVVYLNLDTNNISDLSGIENMKQIKLLYVNYNQVQDIGPLENLVTLENIKLYGNKISNITPLSKLTSLEEIGMYENEISDISVLSGLEKLTYVEFINNNITDVSALKDFKTFERLAITGNPIENIEILSHIKNIEFN